MVTLQEIKEFWATPVGQMSQADTMEMIHRMRKRGFADDVPDDVADNMVEWADAGPGDDAAYYAHKTIAALNFLP